MQTILRRPRRVSPSAVPVTFNYFPSMPGIGTLEIVRGDHCETYEVRETKTDSRYAEGRGFRLIKASRRTKLIDCFVADDADYSECECRSGSLHRQCRHLSTLHALIRSGELDSEGAGLPDADTRTIGDDLDDDLPDSDFDEYAERVAIEAEYERRAVWDRMMAGCEMEGWAEP